MADGSDLGASMARWDRAVANVDRWLMGLAAGVTRLGAKAAGLYPARNPSDGWRVPITFGSGARRFDILIRDGFPFDPPLLALFDREIDRAATRRAVEDNVGYGNIVCRRKPSSGSRHRGPEFERS